MIRRVLIANRGEIAVRIARACRELDVETVAVYSEIDARAPHVVAADRAVCIGPAAAASSYLSVHNLIAAAGATGADAVHPGYGFLSENANFAQACDAAGLVFIGPPPAVIARMGSKIEARRLMQSAGVPVVPGETPSNQSNAEIRRAVERTGLPALLKAAGGGGGKGMRRIDDNDEIDAAIDGARREAVSAFDDGTLYVERIIERARHVEVQVVADADRRVMHLFERECSTQRRHQKVIEESPSPALSPTLRTRMTDAAVQAARAAGYRNAGTVEFLLEESNEPRDGARFYFLEMNTRLQVEHAVTELVTGVDLVRAQLLIASGEPVPWMGSSPALGGHAIEARVYAEDPSRGFLPQAGRVLLYREPRRPGIRIDSGIDQGSDVSVHYDPMLAKVIALAETREIARRRLLAALGDFPILGLKTNIPFLRRILEHPRFVAGDVNTEFLDREGASLAQTDRGEVPTVVSAALAAADEVDERAPAGVRYGAGDPWQRLRGWRN
jgi:3-methylcrotonyl-CoA carboxylase alpha subunit